MAGEDGHSGSAMGLDLRSVAVVCAFLTLLLAVLMHFASARYPAKWRPALLLWSRALFVLPLGWTLLSLREQLPLSLGVALPSLLLYYGFGLLAVALARFMGVRGMHWQVWTVVALTALSTLFFTFVHESHLGRVLSSSPLLALLFFLTARPLLDAFRAGGAVSQRITATVFLTGVALMLARTVVESIPDWRAQGLYDLHSMQPLVLFYLPVAPLIATFGFLLMSADRLHAELEQLATLDPLTGAWNRRAMLEQCARALGLDRRHRRPSALLLLDADHFKRVNDTYGHEAGDAVLRELVRRMREVLRHEDLVGRLGGEEFVALLPGTPEQGAAEVAERLREAVARENFFCRGEEIPLTVSIGVAEREVGEADIAALVQRADRAMYAAKRAGRDRVVTASSLRAAATLA